MCPAVEQELPFQLAQEHSTLQVGAAAAVAVRMLAGEPERRVLIRDRGGTDQAIFAMSGAQALHVWEQMRRQAEELLSVQQEPPCRLELKKLW